MVKTDPLPRPPVRVLQLGSPSGMFGAERWILALAKHLPSNQVETIIGVIQDDERGAEPDLCVHARRLGMRTVVFHAPGKMSRAAVSQLKAFVQSQGIDIVHTHFYKPTIQAALALKGTRASLVATPHGWNTDAGMKLQIYEWIERVAFGWADAVVPLSRDLESGLKKLPWLNRKLTFIQNGVDLSEVTSSNTIASDVITAHERGEFVVGYIGQLIARKRVDTLIEGFAKLQGKEVRLFVVGDGDQATALQELANRLGVADRVNFTGFREDRLDYLRGFDVLALPSALEGIPRCLMEGMAAGVPLLGSDIPGIRDLIIDGQTGLLSQVGDALVMAKTLERLRTEPNLRADLAARARQFVEQSFSATGMAERYLKLFESLRGQPIQPGSVTGPSRVGA
jgi:glycosyltransferase involved in cell wall biosynthesis